MNLSLMLKGGGSRDSLVHNSEKNTFHVSMLAMCKDMTFLTFQSCEEGLVNSTFYFPFCLGEAGFA